MKKDIKTDPLDISGMHYGAKSRIFKNALKLRENMTESEKAVWEYLRNSPLGFKFRRQHPIHTYILDFYCHKKNCLSKSMAAITLIKTKERRIWKERII